MSARGRRPGGKDTRAAIVDAARSVFAQRGYEGASLRGIAREAGVDPKLVHHYFDGKSELFAEVLSFPLDPAAVIEGLMSVPRERLGESLARAFLSVWDDPAGRERFAALFAAAASNDEQARMVREFVGREIFVRLIARLQGEDEAGTVEAPSPQVELRAELGAAHLIGMGVLRYIVRLPAIADASQDELVAILGPSLQRHLLPAD